MADMDKNALARLAFWASNLVAINSARMSWPGFSYSDAEWARMSTLAGAVEPGAAGKFKAINAVIFIVIAAIGIVGFFLPLALVLFPVPAETSALKFSSLLAASAFLIIGLGLPVSMRIAARWSADPVMLARLVPAPEDAALAAKISWQINRITLLMCGALVPGALLFIAYDIQAGPIITALKWAAIVLMMTSTGTVAVRKRR
jgi:hypothetical protein